MDPEEDGGGRVEGKITIIRGAGSESAELFAGEGAPVVIADIDRAGGTEAADRIRAAGGAARFVRTDVAIAQQVEALVEGTAGRPEWIDVFFNNAGILISGGAERRAHERHPPRTSRFGRRSGAGAGIPPSDDRPPASGRRDPPPGVETTSGR